jgi:hypothetical protein
VETLFKVSGGGISDPEIEMVQLESMENKLWSSEEKKYRKQNSSQKPQCSCMSPINGPTPIPFNQFLSSQDA